MVDLLLALGGFDYPCGPLMVVVDNLLETSTLIIQGVDDPLNSKAFASTKCPPRPHCKMRPVGEIMCGLKLITT